MKALVFAERGGISCVILSTKIPTLIALRPDASLYLISAIASFISLSNNLNSHNILLFFSHSFRTVMHWRLPPFLHLPCGYPISHVFSFLLCTSLLLLSFSFRVSLAFPFTDSLSDLRCVVPLRVSKLLNSFVRVCLTVLLVFFNSPSFVIFPSVALKVTPKAMSKSRLANAFRP